MDKDAEVNNVNIMLKSGETIDQCLSYLRSKGLSKIGCMIVLLSIPGIDPKSVKSLVHFSSAWQDRRPNDEAFVDKLIQEAELLADTDQTN